MSDAYECDFLLITLLDENTENDNEKKPDDCPYPKCVGCVRMDIGECDGYGWKQNEQNDN